MHYLANLRIMSLNVCEFDGRICGEPLRGWVHYLTPTGMVFQFFGQGQMTIYVFIVLYTTQHQCRNTVTECQPFKMHVIYSQHVRLVGWLVDANLDFFLFNT